MCRQRTPRIAIPHDIYAPRASLECDCACTEIAQLPTTLIASPDFDAPLHLESPLFEKQLDDSNTLCWNAESSPFPVLLNEDARHFISEFRAPRSLADLTKQYDPSHSRKIAQTLIAAGILSSADEEKEKTNVPKARDTLVAWLHMTNACNLRCDYCYLKKTNEHMDLHTAKASMDAVVRSAVRHGYPRVKIKYAGGEATLRAAQIIEIHEYAVQECRRYPLGLEEVILSNGTLISPELIVALKHANMRLMISLDGLQEDHDVQRRYANGRGSFHEIARNIDQLLEHEIHPHISITVTSRNVLGLPALLEWILERDLTFGINFYRENIHSAGLEDLRLDEEKLVAGMLLAFGAIEERLPQHSLLNCLADRASLGAPHQTPCAAGQDYLVINQNGMVAKCQMEIERPVTSIFADDPLVVLQTASLGLKNLPATEREGCRECTWRFRCAGGCPVETFRATGRYDVKSPNCNIYRALFPEVLRLEGLRILRYGIWV